MSIAEARVQGRWCACAESGVGRGRSERDLETPVARQRLGSVVIRTRIVFAKATKLIARVTPVTLFCVKKKYVLRSFPALKDLVSGGRRSVICGRTELSYSCSSRLFLISFLIFCRSHQS